MKKNPLRKARCYLGGPIENDNTAHNWRVEPSKVLRERFKVNLFDPFSDPKQQWVPELITARDECNFERMAEIAKDFVSKDLIMVERSDFLISYLPKGVPTTGTHHEIIFSSGNKKPTLLVCPQGKQFVPLWYYGWIPHQCMFGSWEALYDYLQEVVEWKHTENRRWKYRYGLI
jgi:hypothetical protein